MYFIHIVHVEHYNNSVIKRAISGDIIKCIYYHRKSCYKCLRNWNFTCSLRKPKCINIELKKKLPNLNKTTVGSVGGTIITFLVNKCRQFKFTSETILRNILRTIKTIVLKLFNSIQIHIWIEHRYFKTS